MLAIRIRSYSQSKSHTSSPNPEYWVHSSCHQVAQEPHVIHSEVV
nr:unnamed protein product [Callosobruchus analis]